MAGALRHSDSRGRRRPVDIDRALGSSRPDGSRSCGRDAGRGAGHRPRCGGIGL